MNAESMTEQAPAERLPIFSKRTDKLLARRDERGIYFWNKSLKEWELFTWEELAWKAERAAESRLETGSMV